MGGHHGMVVVRIGIGGRMIRELLWRLWAVFLVRFRRDGS